MIQLFAKRGIRSAEQASVPTPPTDHRHLVPKSDGWYDKDDAGVETKLGGGSTSPARTTSPNVTNSIVSGAYNSSTITLAKSFRLLSLTVDKPCRVRVYATAAGAAADVARSITTDPPDGRGVILDYVAAAAGTYLLSPLVDGASMETTPVTTAPLVVTNTGGSTQSISVYFSYIPTE